MEFFSSLARTETILGLTNGTILRTPASGRLFMKVGMGFTVVGLPIANGLEAPLLEDELAGWIVEWNELYWIEMLRSCSEAVIGWTLGDDFAFWSPVSRLLRLILIG